AARAGAAGGLSPIAAVISFDLYGALLGNLAAFTFAVFIGATALVWLRTSRSPRWTGWASAVLGLGLLSPIGYFFAALAMVWLIGVSISLYRRGSALSVTDNPATATT
ncbi:MAG: hypothetical protein ACE5JF_08800, partial [Anaerolineales bacterium]